MWLKIGGMCELVENDVEIPLDGAWSNYWVFVLVFFQLLSVPMNEIQREINNTNLWSVSYVLLMVRHQIFL